MPLQKLQLRAGINRSGTNYSNEGGYFVCDKVRFRYGAPEKIGGWVRYNDGTLEGTARGLFCWVTLTNNDLLAIATNVKYYVESDGGLYDITPIRSTVTLAADPFSVTTNSTIVIVNHPSHGAVDGDFVTYSGAVGFDGLASADLNREFKIKLIDSDSYSIDTGVLGTNTSIGGGAAVVAAYQWNGGDNVATPGLGWGAGTWGRNEWGSPADTVTFTQLRLWSQESFGEDHVFCVRGGPIYYWQYSLGLSHRATPLTAIAGGSDVPLMATCLLLSTADRHLIAFGTNPIGSTDQDPLLIRWCDTESLSDWTPSVTNAAGDLRLSSGNHIVTAVRTKQEMLVFTDGSIFALQAVGAPDIFGVTPVSDNISIASPNAVAVAGNTVFWMGDDKFYFYNGRTETLPCSLIDWVFDDINTTQKDQIFAGTNEGFSEIWWFYCSSGSTDIDRYIIYNYDEQLWSYGTMRRSAWLDSPLKATPLATSDGVLYSHEVGTDDNRTTPIHAFIESSDFDIGDGDQYMFITRLLPDVSFTGSSGPAPKVNFTLTARNAPGGGYTTKPAVAVERSVALPVERYTEQCGVRLRGRQVRLRVESDGLGVQWRLGTPRIEVQPDGGK